MKKNPVISASYFMIDRREHCSNRGLRHLRNATGVSDSAPDFGGLYYLSEEIDLLICDDEVRR